MDATECLNNTQWEAYSQGKLAAQEHALMQSHMLTCELCADIKEGIDAMANPDQLVHIVGKLNTAIDKQLATKKARILPIYYWLSAAAILLVSLSVLFFQLPQESLLTSAAIEPELLPSSPNNLPESDQKIKTGTLKKESRANHSDKVQIAQKRADNNIADLVEKEAVVMPQTEEVVVASKLAEVNTSSASLADVAESDAAEAKIVSKTENEMLNSPRKRGKILPAQVSNKNNEPNNGLIYVKDLPVKNLGSVDSLAWNLANQQFDRGSLDSAQASLAPLLRMPFWRDDAEWLQLEIYQKQQQVEAYQALLNRIASRNGKYRNKALLLLK